MAGWKKEKVKEKEKEKKQKKAERGQQAEEQPSGRRQGRIQVRICGTERGLEEYGNVSFVRVVSKRYNLLIMADYLPVIGELEGSVSFADAQREYSREHLKGYFMHKNNEFSLMLESEGKTEAGDAEGAGA